MFFFLATLGCKVNQYESQSVREAWLGLGLTETDDASQADYILLNSCAVTAKAVAELRHMIRRLHRQAPSARIIITGCAAAVEAASLSELDGVCSVVPQEEKQMLLQGPASVIQAAHKESGALLPADTPASARPAQALASAPSGSRLADTVAATSLASAPSGSRLATTGAEQNISSTPATDTACAHPANTWAGTATGAGQRVFPPFRIHNYERSRATVKIQDGCSHGCSYCIVPLTRGRPVSRPWQDIVAEIERLLAAGFREIGLNGINLRQYGQDLRPRYDFWECLAFIEEACQAWQGQMRLRLSSLDPGQLHAKGLAFLRRSRLVAPHLHISLQSGSPAVLARMGRSHYSPEDIQSFVEKLQSIAPHWGLGADILTGFPGETEEEFRQTMALCQSLPLTYAHVFPYSQRPGTVAATMPGQLAAAVKKERARLLRQAIAQKQEAFVQELLGLPTVHVVTEHAPDASTAALVGVNEFYVDCRFVDMPCQAPGRDMLVARPVGAQGTTLLVSAQPAMEQGEPHTADTRFLTSLQPEKQGASTSSRSFAKQGATAFSAALAGQRVGEQGTTACFSSQARQIGQEQEPS